MVESPLVRALLRAATALVLAFIYLPLLILAIYAFNESKRRSVERLLDPAVSRYPLAWLPTYGRKMRDLMGGDPFPFGIEENRSTFEQMLLYYFCFNAFNPIPDQTQI